MKIETEHSVQTSHKPTSLIIIYFNILLRLSLCDTYRHDKSDRKRENGKRICMMSWC